MMKISQKVSLCAVTLLAVLFLCANGAAQTPAGNPSEASVAPLQVAFTFDDLPAHGPLPPKVTRPEVVNSILATLKHENMPPTYGFINGVRVSRFPYQIHILKAWLRAGNPLGNHTWSHPELDKLSASAYERDIAKNEPLLRSIDPKADWHWFRYPFLEEGSTLEKRAQVRTWLADHHYQIAEVSMDFQDYLWNDAYARCVAKRDDGAIEALHSSYLDAADESIRVYRGLAQKLYNRDIPYVLLLHVGAFDARMLPDLVALFRKRGFQFVTLQQAMADPVYAVDPKATEQSGTTFNELVASVRNVDAPGMSDRSRQLDAACR